MADAQQIVNRFCGQGSTATGCPPDNWPPPS